MSTGTKKKREGGMEPVFDLEQQFIMRLPPGPAMALRQELKNESVYLKDKLFIELQSDLRRGAVRYGNDYIPVKMVDLPCVIECQKTVDMKTFYKTADICQMLIHTTEDDIALDENEGPANKKKDKDKKFVWNHGITPPLKNVRKRRFRKTLKKKYMEQPDIEKEVKRLFRTDADAISVKWELVTEDEKGGSDKGDGLGEPGMSGGYKRTDTTVSLDIDIFGELSTSDEEDEKDVNVLDSEEDLSRQQSYAKMEDSMTDMSSLKSEMMDMSALKLDSQYLTMDNLPIDGDMTESLQAQMHLKYVDIDSQLDDITRNMKEEAEGATQNILNT